MPYREARGRSVPCRWGWSRSSRRPYWSMTSLTEAVRPRRHGSVGFDVDVVFRVPGGEAVHVSSGDTAWLLVSAALVMFMTPGLAFFYGGLVRSKNVGGHHHAVIHRSGIGHRIVGAHRLHPGVRTRQSRPDRWAGLPGTQRGSGQRPARTRPPCPPLRSWSSR